MVAAAPAKSSAPAVERPLGMRKAELVSMMAGLMALNALAIDIMLPAMPAMGDALGVSDPNHRQYVITSYLVGLAVAQLFFGPASDRFGRKPPLVVSLGGYALVGLGCIFAPSFWWLVAARALQGIFASGARVIALGIVRDAYKGRGMAEVMSLIMMVFMVVPILAPNIGQVVLYLGPWPWIFAVLVAVGVAMAIWTALRLTESLPPGKRRPIDLEGLLSAYGQVLRTRATVGYTLATGMIFGGLMAFIGSAEQIFSEVFDRRAGFTLYFAGVAGTMMFAALLNSRLVKRFGMRKLSHLALLGFVLLNAAETALLWSGVGGQFLLFYGVLGASFFCFSFIGANFNAIAMEPLGEIAGTAAAFLGFISTLIAAGLGAAIGQQFDGTVIPLVSGFAGVSLAALVTVLITERGRLLTEP